MEQSRNPLNSMTKFVRATLVVARAGHAGCQGTGRDKPVPYDLVPCTSAARARGGTFMKQTPNPLSLLIKS